MNLLGSDPGNPVNITISRSTSAVSTALSGFADAYNAVVSALQNERGQSTGALNGQSVVYAMTSALGSLSTYSAPASAIGGLRNLGLSLNDDGTLTYDASTFMGTDFGNSPAVDSFLGTAAAGGFLQAATNALTGLEDPGTRAYQDPGNRRPNQITSLDGQIATEQAAVDTLQAEPHHPDATPPTQRWRAHGTAILYLERDVQASRCQMPDIRVSVGTAIGQEPNDRAKAR